MRRALLALGVALTVSPGAIPAAHTLAANLQRPPHLDNQPPLSSPSRQDGSGWIMTKPIVPVTTRTVIPTNTVPGSAVARFALQYVGYRYTLVGNSPELGFSCIGFVSYVYRSLGIPLPDDLDNAMAYAPPVQRADLQPGDLLWFQNTVWPGLSHTGIYLGGGRFVHAAWFNLGVIVSSLHHDPRYRDYWTAHYLGASRPWGGTGALVWSALPQTVQTVPDVPVLLVAVPALNVRRWWSVVAPVRTVVQQATPLTVMERHGHWYQIMTPGGTTGWVASAQRLRGIMVDSMAEPGSFAPSRSRPGRALQRAHRKRSGLVRHRAHSRPARIRARASGVRRLQLRGQSHGRPKVSGKKTRAVRIHRTQGAGRRRPVHSRISSGSTRKHPALPARAAGSTSRYQRVLKMLRVRSAPSLRAHVLQLAIPGAYVQVLEQPGTWKHIRLPGGRVGYVYGRYVQ